MVDEKPIVEEMELPTEEEVVVIKKSSKKKKKSKAQKSKKNKKKKKKNASNKYGISEDYTGKEDGFIFKIASVVIKKRASAIICMTIIFAILLSTVNIVIGQNEGRATMMLNYEQSVEGLAPNDTRFNISDFKSDEVINLIIKNAGITNEITAEELKQSITISSVISKEPTTQENYYIPTSFRIVFKKPLNLKSVNTVNMMKVICNTYSQYFYDLYTMNPQILTDDYDFNDSFEYAQVGSYIKLRIDAISSYLKMRSDKGGKFVSESTGETFSSIKKRVDNLKNYSLNNYNSYIWENGIVHDSSKYTKTLTYLNSTHRREKKLNMNEYLIRREVIEYYNSIMSTSVLIPTVNDKNNYYMARTKTGVDYLATDAEYYLSAAKGLEKLIQTDTDKLKKVEPATDAQKHETADIMILKMSQELEQIEKLATHVDKEYKEEHAKNYITFEISDGNIIANLPKKKIALYSLAFMLIAFYVYFIDCRHIAKRGKTK